jgi:hypothetical protein
MLSPKMKIFCMADLLRLAGVAKLLMVWQTDTRSSPSALWILPRCKHYTLCPLQRQVHGPLSLPLSEDGLLLWLTIAERVVSQRRHRGAPVCPTAKLRAPTCTLLQTVIKCAGKESPPAPGGGYTLSHVEGDETREMRWLRGEDPHSPSA